MDSSCSHQLLLRNYNLLNCTGSSAFWQFFAVPPDLFKHFESGAAELSEVEMHTGRLWQARGLF